MSDSDNAAVIPENETIIVAMDPEGRKFEFCKPDGWTAFSNSKGEVMLELRDNGFYVQGERIDDPEDVYRAFSRWIADKFISGVKESVESRIN